jgi:hypothetical protein
MGESIVTRILSRIGVAFAVLVLSAHMAHAQATVPTVFLPSGQPIPAGAIICVDLTGAYVGCGSGGGGGGGAVFGPTAEGSPAANPPVLFGGTADGSATGVVQNAKVDGAGNIFANVTNSFNLEATQLAVKADLDTLAGSISAPIPAGSAIIGKVGIDQTTDGTTNGVHLVAGSALAGKFGIDQTAPGTTNGIANTNQASGVWSPVIGCDLHAFYDASDNGKKTVVAGVSAKKIYVCGYTLATGGTATNLSLTSGTGSDCVTTSTALTPAYQLVANDRVGANAALFNGLKTLANADNLCVNASAGNPHQAEVWYTIQ